MKLEHVLWGIIIVLAVILSILIWDTYFRPEGDPIPIQPKEYVHPKDIEKHYRDIEKDLKENDEKGIGHINPGDALKPPPGPLPPEY